MCPICGRREALAFEAPYAVVSRCSNPACGHLFAVDATPDTGIEPYVDPDAERARFAERDARLIRYLAATAFLDRSSRVLDFGSGTGHLAEAVERFVTGGSVACVEAHPGRRACLERQGFEVTSSLNGSGGPFDCALLVEVIEHVPDPVEVLTSIARSLTPRGRLFVTTPCGESRRGGLHSNAYDSSHHVQFFTERSLRLALSEGGFEDLDLRVIGALYPRCAGLRGAATARSKDLVRRARAKVFGFTHLTGVASKAA